MKEWKRKESTGYGVMKVAGKLYLVATPIGNLQDITFRAIDTLKSVDYIAAEDTRHTKQLLNHFEIKKPLESYHEHNKKEKGKKILEDLQDGKMVALVTDAGTPAISDPGEDLVRLCLDNEVEVTAIPGPVALITGLILSGKDTRRFCFEGFLPTQKKERKERLALLKDEIRTVIFYEAPHKMKKTITDLYQEFGARNITITRELTKKFEEIRSMTLEEAEDFYKHNEPRGEYVLILEGQSEEKLAQDRINKWSKLSKEEHLQYYVDQGKSKNEAIKEIAKDLHESRQEIYKYFSQNK